MKYTFQCEKCNKQKKWTFQCPNMMNRKTSYIVFNVEQNLKEYWNSMV